MTEPYIVEVWGKPAGIVVREGNAFRFRAVAQPFFALDGARFAQPGHARLAAVQLEHDRAHGLEGLAPGHDPGVMPLRDMSAWRAPRAAG